MMDDKTLEYLWTLREINKTLLVGLKAAVDILENRKKFSNKRIKGIVAQIKEIIKQAEIVFGDVPNQKH